MGDERELVDGRLLLPQSKMRIFGSGNAVAVPRLDVGLVLLEARADAMGGGPWLRREPVGFYGGEFFARMMACGGCLSQLFLCSGRRRGGLRGTRFGRFKHGLWRAREPLRRTTRAVRSSGGSPVASTSFLLRHGGVRWN